MHLRKQLPGKFQKGTEWPPIYIKGDGPSSSHQPFETTWILERKIWRRQCILGLLNSPSGQPPLITIWKVFRESNHCVESPVQCPWREGIGNPQMVQTVTPHPSCYVRGSVVLQGQHELRDKRRSCSLSAWRSSQVFKGSLVLWDKLAEASDFGV